MKRIIDLETDPNDQYECGDENTLNEMIQELSRAQQEFNITGIDESGELVEMIQELEPSFRLSEIYKWL